MKYFQGINSLTELQEIRIQLLQSNPADAHLINSEFMQVKDTILGASIKSGVQVKKKFRRIEFKVIKCQETEPGAELRDGCINVSIPAAMIFNTELINNAVKYPKVKTPATMAVFLPPLTQVPLFTIT